MADVVTFSLPVTVAASPAVLDVDIVAPRDAEGCEGNGMIDDGTFTATIDGEVFVVCVRMLTAVAVFDVLLLL